MGLIDDVIDNDNALIFFDTDQVPEVEAVTFTPKDTGIPRTVYVSVFRSPPKPIEGSSAASAPYLEVEMRSHATKGATSINVGGDKFLIAARKGATPVAPGDSHLVDSVLRQEGGTWRLRLR